MHDALETEGDVWTPIQTADVRKFQVFSCSVVTLTRRRDSGIGSWNEAEGFVLYPALLSSWLLWLSVHFSDLIAVRA